MDDHEQEAEEVQQQEGGRQKRPSEHDAKEENTQKRGKSDER